MTTICSTCEPGRPLHVLLDTTQPLEGRTDLCAPEQWLQVSVIPLPDGRRVAPHMHQPRQPVDGSVSAITQETWIVMSGSINIRLFDLDKRLLHEGTLCRGQVLVTFYGGHALECREPGTTLIECRNGPYLGRDYETF